MIEQEEREKEGKGSTTEENGTQPPPQEGKQDEKKVEKEQLSKVIYEGRVMSILKISHGCLPLLPNCFTA